MANYLQVIINQSTNQWLLSLKDTSIHTWAQLRRPFVENYTATCQQPGNKYDLKKLETIQRSRYVTTSNVSPFIRGLRHHDALRNKLLHKTPETIQDLLSVATMFRRRTSSRILASLVFRTPSRNLRTCRRASKFFEFSVATLVVVWKSI